ncbi:uncharacterized protein LOC143578681 [Bidens hawaiensis]|uniref:uncharacterized protein LOC143578681 n=1 Tax=Bidens hawaiensis TaxID=980011 RepID=UPI004049B909
MAKEQINGNFKSQYRLLRDYIEEVKNTNPGFKAIGRDLLGFDGAFLKIEWHGQLLTTVGLDPNNGYYPLAYAVVEAETMLSWQWFLQCLRDDLDMDSRSKFTFMSDRQKGLIQAVERVFPCTEHRYCLRYITENMKKIFKGKIYKDSIRKLATCTTAVHYEREMHILKRLNKRAHLWVSKIPPSHWSKSHFTGRALSNVLINKMCEVFHSKLVDGRDKPIITLLEYMREYLMRKIVNVLKVIDKSLGLLTPYATNIMESVNKEANRYTMHWNGKVHYQVTGPNSDQWEVIGGIPYRHVVASIWVKAAHDPDVGKESFVTPIYTMERCKAVYSYKVYPINGMSMWPKSHGSTLIIEYHKPIGRSKKYRKKSHVEKEEATIGKKGKKVKGKSVEVKEQGPSKKAKIVRKARPPGSNACGGCCQKGHNIRSCLVVV